jgi:pimeloyl-ACP methyl ester carboxylesterase
VLGQVKTPTLILHGTQDRRVPLSTAYYLAERLPDARLYLFEGAGHLPIFTATGEFCDVSAGSSGRGRLAPGDHSSSEKDTHPCE